ncbi:hypothetical protein DB30_04983 [Enhygromyxa salina]|uniref:Uncharacterized protein n=1 Tax=Enhygromyxa salina TaxID=215803 RepID=A0A0C2CYQ2_9BACT|nr:hypothetical protein [Enhygromyxa salina]KIG16111.1 hypothetical protein DB30_04983 [Enhygromyxa salina]
MGLFDSMLAALGLRNDTTPVGDEQPTPVDPARDLALEQQDDAASFDFAADIARYFTAEFRVDTAWSRPARRDGLFAEYGIRDVAHWYQVKATFARWLESPDGKSKYPTEDALIQARLTTTQTMGVDDLDLLP